MTKISNILKQAASTAATGVVMTGASILAKVGTTLYSVASLPTIAQFGKLCATTFTAGAPAFLGVTAVALVIDAAANALLKNACPSRPKLNFLLRKTITIVVVSLVALAMGASPVIPIAVLSVLLAKEILAEWRKKRISQSDGEQSQLNEQQQPQKEDENLPRIDQKTEELFNSIRKNSRAPTDKKVYGTPSKQIEERIKSDFQRIRETGKYYVFIHAMSAGIGVYYDVINHLREDKKTNPFNKKFRLQTGEDRSLVSIKKQLQNEEDNDLKGLVSSVDANVNHNVLGESAWDFFKDNRSVRANLSTFIPYITNELQLKTNLKTQFEKQLIQGFDKIVKNSSSGRMALIAIKKETIEVEKTNYVYSSHPFGKPCKCHSKTEKKDKLEVEKHDDFLLKLQKNQNGESGTCNGDKQKICQYRIVSDKLEQDPNKVIFYFDTRTVEQKKEAKKVMRAVKTMIDSIKEAKNDKEIEQAINSCAI